MAAALSLNGPVLCSNPSPKGPVAPCCAARRWRRSRWWGSVTIPHRSGPARRPPSAGSRADDSSAPYEMTVESALKLLGVSEGASFDDILRAKNAVLASCKDDMEAAAQVEAAYDMLLMQRLSRRRAGKVANGNIRYADIKPIRSTGTGALPEWLQKTVKNIPVSVESPSTNSLGIQAGVYGALTVLTFVSGSSPASAGPYTGADVPGLILATSFGASLYFLSKKKISLGKAVVITIGGLVVGAVIGSAVEQWLQFLVSLYLR
ncbi:hypothetical protein OPV22_002457 [Ensete ventricosum]|uniref:Protein CHAPERONE-LIKE PROTEIN OF POR1, chloroplastic n=1 Tax=Ensete ventricosum TaxID=4639 RepID=A0AAV8RY01_ENSVE|nr:hypothetical protein OPV22_002457 [Ensete ventricosum]